MALTPVDGVRAMRVSAELPRPNRLTTELPVHLADWQLPPDWRWGGEGVASEFSAGNVSSNSGCKTRVMIQLTSSSAP